MLGKQKPVTELHQLIPVFNLPAKLSVFSYLIMPKVYICKILHPKPDRIKNRVNSFLKQNEFPKITTAVPGSKKIFSRRRKFARKRLCTARPPAAGRTTRSAGWAPPRDPSQVHRLLL